MDNEKEVFLQSFKDLENQFQVLPIDESQLQRLKTILSGIQKIAENLALYDPLTHAFNTRAGEWLVPNEHIKGMAKIDIYDLRQANKVYGVAVADSELHKLAYHLMSMFTVDMGDFVCRSPGSDPAAHTTTSFAWADVFTAPTTSAWANGTAVRGAVWRSTSAVHSGTREATSAR